MYATKPFNENIKITTTSTTMYKCKSYYEDIDSLNEETTNTNQQVYFIFDFLECY